MSWAQERADIEARLNTNWSTTSIAFDNVAFIPTPGTAWIRCSILPGNCEALEFGRDTDKQYFGIISIGIFTPQDTGNNVARGYADTIAAIFDMQVFGTIDCDEAYVQNLGVNDGWFNLVVTIPYSRIE